MSLLKETLTHVSELFSFAIVNIEKKQTQRKYV